MDLYISHNKTWVSFKAFYCNSCSATKVDTNFQEVYARFIQLIPQAFDPLVWGQSLKLYPEDNELLNAVFNLLSHFVEIGGLGLDLEYITSAATRSFSGADLSITDPILLITEFGREFVRIHSLKYGIQESSDNNHEVDSDFSIKSDEGSCFARGYQLDVDIHVLRKYLVVKNGESINIHGLFFNGAKFHIKIKAGCGDDGTLLNYQCKTKTCKINKNTKHNSAVFSITAS